LSTPGGGLCWPTTATPSFPAVAGIRRQYAEKAQLWVTTDYVLDETITRLFAGTPFASPDFSRVL
jgi:hypothetical protein